jgi:hypothetical protein
MSDCKQFVVNVLEQMRGDDLQRARFRFRHYTEEQMNKPYGQSDRTPVEILAMYEAHETQVNAAIAWVKSK